MQTLLHTVLKVGKYAVFALGAFAVSFFIGGRTFSNYHLSDSPLHIGPPQAHADVCANCGDDSDSVGDDDDDAGDDGGDNCSGGDDDGGGGGGDDDGG